MADNNMKINRVNGVPIEDTELKNNVNIMNNELTTQIDQKASDIDLSIERNRIDNLVKFVESEDGEVEIIFDPTTDNNEEIQNKVGQKIDELKNEINVERNRINSISSLAEGSTTGDAELIDIRTGVDGNVYGNAGTAVREQVKDLSSQIKEKADKITTNNIQQQVNNLVLGAVGDGNNAEVVQARGNYNTLNERLDETDSITVKNISTNLINTNNFLYVLKNGSTYERIDNITYKITCNESWGGTLYHRIKASYNRKYMIICKVKAGNDDSIGENCWPTFYQYDSSYYNIGEILVNDNDYYNRFVELTSDYSLLYYAITVSNANTAYLDLGVSSTQNTTFVLSECIILDVTPLTFEELKGIDFPKYGYWTKRIENFSNSQYSLICGKALDLNDNIKQNIIDTSISKSLCVPFIDESNKLTWTTKSYSSGEHIGWWIENKTTGLSANSKYVFIVKWDGTDQAMFQECNELRNSTWYNTSTITHGVMNNTNTKVVAWMFNTDTVSSPGLCLVINSGTLSSNVDITVELYRIDNDSYINQDVAIKLAAAYRDGHTIKDYDFSNKIKWSDVELRDETKDSKWKNKKALVIGDSITAAGQWQQKLNTELGMQVKTHAKGGVDIISMVDGDKGLGGDYDNVTNAGGTLYPLNTEDVGDKDLIVVLPAYNERGLAEGIIGDCYNPDTKEGNTIIGKIQYLINRLYEELTNADNLNCKIIIATPHCAGKYNYIDADGYEEFPTNSGRTMETLSNTIKQICNYNNIPVCDLWHNSGINKFTWNIYGASSNPVNSNYTKYELNEQGEVIGSSPMRYVKGNSYYQLRNGQVVLEEYTGDSPYPFNGDQLHCNSLGYARIGECIVGSIINSYGY